MRMNCDIFALGNFSALMRCGGKIVPGSQREGHNVFTVTGRNFLSKLVAWQSLGANDVPYTQRRIRWIGVGSGTQLEVATVTALNQPALITSTQYLVTPQAIEFPTSSSVRFIREFALGEITVSNAPVKVSEIGLFADVNPVSDGYEDVAYDPGIVDSVLSPYIGTNSPVAYKTFEGLTKTVDFTLEIRWDFRFE